MGDCCVVILEAGLELSRGPTKPWSLNGAVIRWTRFTSSQDLPSVVLERQELRCSDSAPSSKSRGFTPGFQCMFKQHKAIY